MDQCEVLRTEVHAHGGYCCDSRYAPSTNLIKTVALRTQCGGEAARGSASSFLSRGLARTDHEELREAWTTSSLVPIVGLFVFFSEEMPKRSPESKQFSTPWSVSSLKSGQL